MPKDARVSYQSRRRKVLPRNKRLSGWAEFFCASVVFLLSHSLPARPAMRVGLTRWLGGRVYLVAYSAVSLAVLAWLIVAADRAPFLGLWTWSPEHVWAANILMLFAILLAIGGTGIANPFSIGGISARSFVPSQPGIVAVTRHPLLWSFAFWSLAHLLANGDLAHVLLFGSLGAFSILGILVMETRARRRMDVDWSRLSAGTSVVPFYALLAGKARRAEPVGWRVLLAPPIWAALVWLHGPVVGVSPLPPL